MGVGIKGFGGTAGGIEGISALPPAAVAAKGIFVGGDPDIANVKLRMTMTDNTEELGATVTTNTGSPTFGNGSTNAAGDAGSVLLLDGNDSLTVANTNVSNLTDVWTIEYWHLADTLSIERATLASYNTGELNWAFHSNTDLLFLAGTGAGSWNIVTGESFNITTGTFFHIAVSYDGTTYRGFKDGIEQWNVVSAVDVGVSTQPVVIGVNPTGNKDNQFHLGKLDDIRITIGTARYTSNFTKPTTEFPLS